MREYQALFGISPGCPLCKLLTEDEIRLPRLPLTPVIWNEYQCPVPGEEINLSFPDRQVHDQVRSEGHYLQTNI